jgi:hypothetical protein
MVKTYEWLNQNKKRYYKISVHNNGTDSILLNYYWGGCHSRRGGKKNLLLQTPKEVEQCIDKMMKRRKSRGYELISS